MYLQPLFSSYIYIYYIHTCVCIYNIHCSIYALKHACTVAPLQWCTYIPRRTISYVCVHIHILTFLNLLTGRVKRKNVPLYCIKYKSPGCRTHPPDRPHMYYYYYIIIQWSRSKLRAYMHIMSFIFIFIGSPEVRPCYLVFAVCTG